MEYLARLSKRLQACLVYPQEVRKSGIEGVSRIRFVITETGTVKPGSLTVVKSSGYPALDSNALKAALAGSPYEKPPKELLVTIAVAFTMEMATRRG
jgi:protein TonB